jgi:hypothetical protein
MNTIYKKLHLFINRKRNYKIITAFEIGVLLSKIAAENSIEINKDNMTEFEKVLLQEFTENNIKDIYKNLPFTLMTMLQGVADVQE